MLTGKTILITGASSGIGLATAQHVLAQGATVVGIGRDLARLKTLQGNVLHICTDLTQFDSYDDWIKDLPTIDGVVHSAGIVENNPIKFFSLEKYQRTIDINQTAPLVLVSRLMRLNKINKNASVVLLSSINGNGVAIKGCAAYAASKAALTGIAKVLALELAPKGIRVNCVQPGMVETELVTDLTELTEETTRLDKARYPLGQRYAKAPEIASAIEFLLSNASSFMTGQSLIIDGGFSVQ